MAPSRRPDDGKVSRGTPGSATKSQNRAVAQLLAGDISAARASFRQAIALLRQQGQTSTAEQLQRQAGAMVRLDD